MHRSQRAAAAAGRPSPPRLTPPRGAGYLNVWTVLLFLPGPMCVFFKTGPFAWDGLFAWWIPFVVFMAWMVIMLVLVRRSIDQPAVGHNMSAGFDTAVERQIAQIVESRIEALRAELTRETN